MNWTDIEVQIEQDRTWRLDELRFLSNQLSSLTDQESADRFRRTMVVMLYAHLEGFTKTVLTIYVDAINRLGLACGGVNYHLVASTLNQVFSDVEQNQKKSDFFRRHAPDDSKLHRHFRRVELIARLDELNATTAKIDAETIVNTEGNLTKIVFQKLLYQLGLDLQRFESIYDVLQRLVHRRNQIAHGGWNQGIRVADYTEYEKAALDTMQGLIVMIREAVEGGRYKLRQA